MKETSEPASRRASPYRATRVPEDGGRRPGRHGRAARRPADNAVYERPKTRAEAQAWIDWNQRLYREQGFGLWVVMLKSTGEFAGDCGLTPQSYDGVVDIEVGYRIRTDLQGQGYATEAAAACRDFARDVLDIKRLIAIINPDNVPSQRVAEKVGLAAERDTTFRTGAPIRIYAAAL